MATGKHKKGKSTDATAKEKEKRDRLFTEADAQFAELQSYPNIYEASQPNQPITKDAIPTGAVEIDASVKLAELPLNADGSSRQTKENTISKTTDNNSKQTVHLPSITNQRHHPYEYLHESSSRPQHVERLPYIHPSHYERQSNYRRHHHHHYRHHHHNHDHNHDDYHHHHHHHHHGRHHYHENDKEVETYDSRWWYLPLNSVHAPKQWQPPEYHYVPPKWYELSSRESRRSISRQDSILSPRKLLDCRCEYCRPSRPTPRGIRWVVNEENLT